MSNQRKITEAEVRNAVRRALKQVLEDIENEPKLIIEAGPDNTMADPAQLEDILSWLFKRKEADNDN